MFETEPVADGDPILTAPSVVAVPHALGFWNQLFRDCVAEACAVLLDVAAGRVPRDVVNPAVLASSRFRAKLERFACRGGAWH